MVFRYVFGQMAASATVSGSPTSIGDSLPPLDTGPSDTQVISPPVDTPRRRRPPRSRWPLPAVTDDGSGYDSSGGSRRPGCRPRPGRVDAGGGRPGHRQRRRAPSCRRPAPISGTPMTLVDTASIYLILVAGATVALLGGTVLRLMGVKLKWTS